MAHEKRFKVMSTAVRMAYTPVDGEPVIDSDRRAAGMPFAFNGDGATAGGILVPRNDDVVHYEWTGHGRSLPATGIDAVVSDGTTLTNAQATTPLRPSFYIVRVPDANNIGLITSGLAVLANSSLDAGKAYWLDPATPNTLVDAEPALSVPVCEVLHKVGTAAFVRFIDWRAQNWG